MTVTVIPFLIGFVPPWFASEEPLRGNYLVSQPGAGNIQLTYHDNGEARFEVTVVPSLKRVVSRTEEARESKQGYHVRAT
jgi:hypothetical protein